MRIICGYLRCTHRGVSYVCGHPHRTIDTTALQTGTNQQLHVGLFCIKQLLFAAPARAFVSGLNCSLNQPNHSTALRIFAIWGVFTISDSYHRVGSPKRDLCSSLTYFHDALYSLHGVLNNCLTHPDGSCPPRLINSRDNHTPPEMPVTRLGSCITSLIPFRDRVWSQALDTPRYPPGTGYTVDTRQGTETCPARLTH